MNSAEWKKRIMSTTRGRIMSLLRASNRTVNELAAALRLADNTVRSHLGSLERDGLVKRSGTTPGTRKPHFAYVLTPAGEGLFLQSCDPLLDCILSVLAANFSSAVTERVLREAGTALGDVLVPRSSDAATGDPLERALGALRSLGGVAEIDVTGRPAIVGQRCPLAPIVSEHPEVCYAAEALVVRITGLPFRESCTRGPEPKCRFELAGSHESTTAPRSLDV